MERTSFSGFDRRLPFFYLIDVWVMQQTDIIGQLLSKCEDSTKAALSRYLSDVKDE